MPSNRQRAVRSRSTRQAAFFLTSAALTFGATTAAVTFAPDAGAEDKTAFLAGQLKNNSDFRIRTSAALSLGTSEDPKAVQPLCGCLGDKTETESVRVACAAALGKMKKAGAEASVCLKGVSADKSKKVSEQAGTSLKSLGSSASGSGPIVTDACPSAPAKGKPKYYVGVDVNNKTSRPDSEIKALIAKEVRCKLLGNGGRFKLADDIDPKKMGSIVSKEKLDGYFITMQVDPIKYDGGQVKISMKLSIMTHNRDFKGEIGKTLATTASKPSK
ncbi:MAG: HEAT repeat domain-containing protein, partial [Polyangiales bacterium]